MYPPRLRVQHDLRRGGGDQKQEERGGAGEGDHPGDGWGLTNTEQEQEWLRDMQSRSCDHTTLDTRLISCGHHRIGLGCYRVTVIHACVCVYRYGAGMEAEQWADMLLIDI